MKKLIFIVLPAFCLILACNSNTESTVAETTQDTPTIAKGAVPETTTRTTPSVKELPKELPESYIAADLPIWEKATVERASQVQSGSAQRYQVVLSSTEDIHTIASYYDKEMKKKGWKADKLAKAGQKENRRTMTFQKDNHQVMINVLKVPNETRQFITMMFPEMRK